MGLLVEFDGSLSDLNRICDVLIMKVRYGVLSGEEAMIILNQLWDALEI